MEILFLNTGGNEAFSFRERRESFFAQGVNAANVVTEEAETSKKQEEEKESGVVIDFQNKRLTAKKLYTQLLENPEGTKSLKEIELFQKKNGTELLEAVKKDSFNSRDQQKIDAAILEESNKKKVAVRNILGDLRAGRSIGKDAIKTIAQYSLSGVLDTFDELSATTSDRKKLLDKITDITKKTSDVTKDLRKALEKEIGVLIDDEGIQNSERKQIFTLLLSLKKHQTHQEKSIQEIASEILSTHNIQNSFIRNTFAKGFGEKIRSVLGIEDALSQAEGDSLSEKEIQMYEIVKNTLDDSVAEKAKKAMEKNTSADNASRSRAFLEVIENSLLGRIHIIQSQGLEFVQKEITKSENLLKMLIDLCPGLDISSKNSKKRNITNGYKAFHLYLKALQESKDENSNIPVLKFFFTGGGNDVTEEYRDEYLSPFTKKEAQLAYHLEEERIQFQQQVELAKQEYVKNQDVIDTFLSKKDTESIQNSDLLTSSGAAKIIQREKSNIPTAYRNIRNLQVEYGLSHSEIIGYLESPLQNTFPESAIKTVLKTQEVPQNIIQFFAEDRILKGSKVILQNLSGTESNILSSANNYGWMEKGEITKLTEKYKHIVSKSDWENFFAEQKEKMQRMENILLERAQSSEHRVLFENSARFLEEKRNEIKLPFNESQWLDEAAKFSKKMATLKKKDTKSGTNMMDGINQVLAVRAQELESILNPIEHALDKSDKELAFSLRGFKFPAPPEKPSLDELSWKAQSPLFHIMAKGEGLTPAGVLEIQKLMSTKNKYDEFFIQSRTMLDQKYNLDDAEFGATGNYKVYFLPDKEFIVLPDDIYAQIKNFDSHSENISEIDEALGFIFHEQTHNLVQASGHKLLEDFESLLNQKMQQFAQFKMDANTVFAKNKGVSPLEEVLANVGSMLQFSSQKRNEILGNQSEENLYGMGLSLRKLVQQVFAKVGEDAIKTLFADNITLAKGQKETIQNVATADAGQNIEDQEGQENQSDEESSKSKDQPLNSGSRNGKLSEFENIKKDAVLYIQQLEDSRNLFPSDQQKKLDQWVEYFNNKLEDIENNIKHEARTESDADKQIKDAESEVKNKAKGFIYQISSANQDQPNFLIEAWKNTEFLSMSDIGQIFTTTWEYIKRRYGTKQKRRIGKVGSNMFGGIMNGLSGEFHKEELNAENTEVGEIQGALENASDAEVREELEKVNNVDSFKAVMQELSKRGLIVWEEWEDPKKPGVGERIYIKKLKEMGSTVRFYDSDFIYDGPEAESQSLLNSKLNKAFLQIYGDESMFNQIYNENKNQIESRVKNGVDVANQRGGVPEQLNDWLKMAHNGEHVPWHDYEGYIQFMVDDGTTDPSYYMYYLIMGVKEGAITKDAFMRFYKMANSFPPSDEIRKWSTQEIKDAADQILPPGHKSWEGIPESYIPWVHANIMTSDAAVERTIMNLGQKGINFDHDNAHLLAAIGSADSGVRFLSAESTGKVSTKETIYNQAILGMMTNITSVSMYEKEAPNGQMDYEKLKETIRRQAGYFTAFDAMGNKRMDGAKGRFSFTDTFLNKAPRAGDSYNGNMNTKEYLEMGRAIFSQGVDENFRRLCKDLFFNTSLDHNPKATQAKWEELSQIPEIRDQVFHGSPPPMEAGKNTPENTYANIIDRVFTYYLTESNSSEANLRSITNAAYSVANGKGIPGVEDSEKWGYTSLSPENGEASKLPGRFNTRWK